jgi:signal transduction histidine kinase
LALAADEVAEGNYATEVPDVSGKDEIADLAGSFSRMTERLAESEALERNFLMTVSHELRTPLTAIRGYVEALLDLVPADAEQRRFLEIIARHSARMEGLVKDLLRLTRLEAGQEPLDRIACAPAQLFDGVVHDLEPVLGRRHQQVTTSVAADATSLVGDPAKLHDVLRNLIENAANYAPEGTTISLSARRDPDHIALVVEDEGPGIPDADLQRIFERFYRVDKARSRETGGTGLGLSIVKHLVGLHGGDVRAENRPTGGARFTVRIPA